MAAFIPWLASLGAGAAAAAPAAAAGTAGAAGAASAAGAVGGLASVGAGVGAGAASAAAAAAPAAAAGGSLLSTVPGIVSAGGTILSATRKVPKMKAAGPAYIDHEGQQAAERERFRRANQSTKTILTTPLGRRGDAGQISSPGLSGKAVGY